MFHICSHPFRANSKRDLYIDYAVIMGYGRIYRVFQSVIFCSVIITQNYGHLRNIDDFHTALDVCG